MPEITVNYRAGQYDWLIEGRDIFNAINRSSLTTAEFIKRVSLNLSGDLVVQAAADSARESARAAVDSDTR